MSSEAMTSEAMTSDATPTTISVRGVGKSYRMYESPSHRLWQGLFGKRRTFFRDFWALRNVDLQVYRGETVGIVGRNGSGKSTLLQLIAGTLTPTEGQVQVNGRVAALLELGSGFNPDFTGRENVYLNGALHGLSRAQIDERMGAILAFADIGEFIDQPIRSYSSGMVVRLAFAVIVHVDADVLIIDEALAVGDAFFAQKCMRFLRKFKEHGTLLFVSHDAAAVTNLCERALWLENGAARMVGTASEVVEAYMREQHSVGRREISGDAIQVGERKGAKNGERAETDLRTSAWAENGVTNNMRVFEFDPDAAGVEFGAGKATITRVALQLVEGESAHLVRGGELVDLTISAQLHEDLEDLIFGFYVKDRLGQRLFGDNSYLVFRETPIRGAAGETVSMQFRFRMPILPVGSYMIDAALASGTQLDHTQQHWIHDALEFRALDETMRFGLVGIPMLDMRVRTEAQ